MWSVVMWGELTWFMWSGFILKWSEVKWSEVGYGEVLVDKVLCTLEWPCTEGTFLHCGYFHLGISCVVFVLIRTVVTLYCFVMCGCFGNLYYVYCHSSTTLTEVFPCFFLSCKANAGVKLAKMGHGPHSSKLVVICVVLLLLVLFCCYLYCSVVICVVLSFFVFFYVLFVFVLFYVLFVCKCVLYYCHRVLTKCN